MDTSLNLRTLFSKVFFGIIFAAAFVVSGFFVSDTYAVEEVTLTNSSDFTIDTTTFSPALGASLDRNSAAYYSVRSTSSSSDSILGVQWRITVEGPSALTPDVVDLDEVGWKDISPAFSLTIFHYPFATTATPGQLVATGSCADSDPEHSNTCTTDTFDVDPNDDFTNVDRVEFNASAPLGTYTIKRVLVDSEGNPISNELTVATVNVTDALSLEVTVAPKKIDLENYQGGQNNYFNDPKCTTISYEASDTHSFTVTINVNEVLLEMFANIVDMPSFNATSWAEYLADPMHNYLQEVPSGSFEGGLEFCPGEHIWHLSPDEFDVIDSDDFLSFISEKLVLGEFDFVVTATDVSDETREETVTVLIADLTVPLEAGWNLRSTPIALEGDIFFPSDSVDVVLRWDSGNQEWELVTDNHLEPLDALYIHATGTNQLGYVFERDLTSPPVRLMQEGWNLAGMALPLQDYWSWYDNYSYLNDNYSPIGPGALNPLVFDGNSNQALEMVVSPSQSLSYGNDWGSWYFNQYPFVWIPVLDGNEIENGYAEYVQNFGGYWLFMQNPDSLPGQTTTPLPLNWD